MKTVAKVTSALFLFDNAARTALELIAREAYYMSAALTPQLHIHPHTHDLPRVRTTWMWFLQSYPLTFVPSGLLSHLRAPINRRHRPTEAETADEANPPLGGSLRRKTFSVSRNAAGRS